MIADAIGLGLIIFGMIAFFLTTWRRHRAKRTFLRSRDGSIVQLYGPYRRRR